MGEKLLTGPPAPFQISQLTARMAEVNISYKSELPTRELFLASLFIDTGVLDFYAIENVLCCVDLRCFVARQFLS